MPGKRLRIKSGAGGLMTLFRWAAGALIAALFVFAAASSTFADEPRPWLCRDKPVFSSDRAMTYVANKRGGGRWMMTFMRFDPSGGGHDGFTVVSTRMIRGAVSGSLEPGQWYAVALYHSGGHWICPGGARESDERTPGVVSDLCFGEDPGSCPVKLTVRPADTAPVH
jgi:hypothetical protein